MAPLNGAAEPDFWAKHQIEKEHAAMTVVLASLPSQVHSLSMSAIANVIGEGKLSQAATRSKLTQLIGQGQQRIHDHRKRSRAARDVSDSVSDMSQSSSGVSRRQSPMLARQALKQRRKRARDDVADQDSDDDYASDQDPQLDTPINIPPTKKSRRSVQKELPAHQAKSREEISKKHPKRVRVRKLKSEDFEEGLGVASPCIAGLRFRGSHETDNVGTSSEPGKSKETAIYLSDEGPEPRSQTHPEGWYRFDTDRRLEKKRASMDRSDVEGDAEPSELSEQLQRELMAASIQDSEPLRPKDTLCDGDDGVNVERNAPHEERSLDRVRSKGRKSARATDTKKEHQRPSYVEKDRPNGDQPKSEKASGRTGRGDSSVKLRGVTIRPAPIKTYMTEVQSKLRPWQAGVVREISMSGSPRIQPSNGSPKP